ncbi:hypothetical protein DH09_01070 (plasmid) [Bacillaceae bacterium JMAK1]|nr:hypothetical protein DH09_01070 [Bacillaceae bacterium JMAK1]
MLYYPYNRGMVYQNRVSQETLTDLQTAINGEYSAIQCYEQIANRAPDDMTRNQIVEIRNDEIEHFNDLSKAYTRLTGQQPQAQITEPCPSSYSEDILSAFKDEQNTVDFYNKASDRSSDLEVKRIFSRAALDEQQHAVWFLYFLTNR